jgi:membrane-associated phospholipid phosphatase
MLEFIPYMMVGGAVVLTSSPLLFFVMLFINDRINKWLKNSIQDPRPKDCEPYMRKSFGMPSAHTQNASFAAAFIWSEVNMVQQIVLIMLTLITMVQRVYSHCHTVPQVLVGLIVGIIVGLLTYRATIFIKIQRERNISNAMWSRG